jgi:hypothetical protein
MGPGTVPVLHRLAPSGGTWCAPSATWCALGAVMNPLNRGGVFAFGAPIPLGLRKNGSYSGVFAPMAEMTFSSRDLSSNILIEVLGFCRGRLYGPYGGFLVGGRFRFWFWFWF